MQQKIKKLFDKLQTNENWFRFGTAFETQNKKYFLDTGTGKIFEVENSVFSVLDCILRTNNFDNLSKLGLNDEEMQKAYDKIKQAIDTEHILQAPPVKTMIGQPLTDLRDSLQHAMSSITLEVTQRCNLRCKYCIYGDDRKDFRGFESKDMSIDTAKQAIDFLLERGSKEIYLGFYGGEPLLRFDFIKESIEYMQEHLKDRKVHYSMTSNMTLMTEEMADFIASFDNFTVTASLDGPEDIHDEHRKFADGTGSFDATIKGVKRLVDAQSKHGVNTPILFSAVLTPPYTAERFDKIQNLVQNLSWLPAGSSVQTGYVSREAKKSEYIPINERPENRLFSEEVKGYVHDPLEEWTIFGSEQDHEKTFSYPYLIKPLNLIHRRKIHDTPFQYYTMNGCCIPGGRKAYVTVDGGILPCERVGTVEPIGDVFSGFYFDFLQKNYVDDYISEAVKYCGECWAINICSNCYSDCMSPEGKIDFAYRNNACRSTRKQIRYDLVCYHEVLERYPETILKLNDIEVV